MSSLTLSKLVKTDRRERWSITGNDTARLDHPVAIAQRLEHALSEVSIGIARITDGTQAGCRRVSRRARRSPARSAPS